VVVVVLGIWLVRVAQDKTDEDSCEGDVLYRSHCIGQNGYKEQLIQKHDLGGYDNATLQVSNEGAGVKL
jgi:hypothetical protein